MVVRPDLKMPAVTQFIDGTGPVWSGSLFPFLFITIACGAVSGFHALISSGTTPKMLENESQIRFIGYGGMLTESFVAIMALIAASVLDPGVYFAMNSPAGADRHHAVQTAAQVISGWGFVVTPDMLTQIAKDVGENTLLSRTGGAPTLAVGMAQILSGMFGGKAMMAFWYHFAILFEALFILTTVDAGTRVLPLHAPGSGRQRRPSVQARPSLGQQPDRIGAGGGGLGLLPLPGRDRSARRHQHAVAAVRHRQPDAGRHRADPVHRGAVQDEARALRLGDAGPDLVAAGLHADRRAAEDLPSEAEHRLPGPRRRCSATRSRQGKVLAPAKNLEQMSRIVFNDYVNTSLTVAFVACVLAMMVFGFIGVRRALGSPGFSAIEVGAVKGSARA